MACLSLELLSGLLTDTVLEVADHQREGMGTRSRSNAVDRVFIFSGIGCESGVNCLFQSFETEADRDDIGAQQLHPCDIGCLLGYIHLTHIDVALEPEVGCCSSQGHAVLSGAGLGDQFLFPHIFGQQTLAHTVVELVGAGVVEIFALEINLCPSQKI